MDAHILQMHHYPPRGEDFKPLDIAITFNKRIRLWKDMVAKIPLPKESKDRNIELADRARTARNHRDLLLHGLIDKTKDGRVTAIRPNAKAKKIQRIPITEAETLNVAEEILLATSDILSAIVEVNALLRAAFLQKSDEEDRLRGSRPSPSTPDKP